MTKRNVEKELGLSGPGKADDETPLASPPEGAASGATADPPPIDQQPASDPPPIETGDQPDREPQGTRRETLRSKRETVGGLRVLADDYPRSNLRKLANDMARGIAAYPERRVAANVPLFVHVEVTPDTARLLQELADRLC